MRNSDRHLWKTHDTLKQIVLTSFANWKTEFICFSSSFPSMASVFCRASGSTLDTILFTKLRARLRLPGSPDVWASPSSPINFVSNVFCSFSHLCTALSSAEIEERIFSSRTCSWWLMRSVRCETRSFHDSTLVSCDVSMFLLPLYTLLIMGSWFPCVPILIKLSCNLAKDQVKIYKW